MAPLLSSEPGYYRDGEFGIRIEDVALVVQAQTKVTPAPLALLPEGPGAASSPQPPFPGLCIRLGGQRGGRGAWEQHWGGGDPSSAPIL